MSFFEGVKVFFFGVFLSKRDSVRTPRKGAKDGRMPTTTKHDFQTVVALLVDVVIPGWTASEQLNMPPRHFAAAFARLPLQMWGRRVPTEGSKMALQRF